MQVSDKWVPISIEAEQGLIGAILVNNQAMNFVADIVVSDHFGETLHGYLFETMKTLIDAGKVADPIMMMRLIPDQLIFEGMTTQKYLARLCADATTIINARDYALTIRDLAKRREMMLIADEIRDGGPADTLKLATSAIERIDGIVADLSNSATRGESIGKALAQSVDAAAKAFQADGRIIGVPSGLTKLDRKLLGFSRGDLVIMAGRPGMGKSAVMVTCSRTMGEAGFKQIIFSQEMGSSALGQRMIADDLFDTGPIPYFALRAGTFSEETFSRVTASAARLAELPLQIEPQPAQSVAQIAARARQAKRKGGLDVIWIDHLQIMKATNQYQNRVHQIGEITGALKALAKELDIVVIVLSQLSRSLESREEKRPVMSDLRDSGDIEQDADVIIMLFRPSYYLLRREPGYGSADHAEWQTACFRANNRLELLIEKQRSGPTGTVEVFCNIGCNAVRDIDEQEVEATPAHRTPYDQEPVLL